MAQSNINLAVDLCSLCSLIEFDVFRLPTAAQLRRVANGQDVPAHHPFQNRDGMPLRWQLGSVQRVLESAESCTLCRIIADLVHDVRQAGGHIPHDMDCRAIVSRRGNFRPPTADKISPIMLKRMGYREPHELVFKFSSMDIRFSDNDINSRTHWPRTLSANDWLHVCDMESENTSQLFMDEVRSDDEIMFSRRRLPGRFEIEMLSGWLRECVDGHDNSCGTTSEQRYDCPS